METLQDVTLMNYGAFGLKAMEPDRVIGQTNRSSQSCFNKTYEKTRKSLDKNFQIFLFQKNLLK